MFPLMRTFINTQHSTSIIQPHNQTSSLRCALHQHLTLNTYHPTNMFPQMRTHQHPSLNTHHPSNMFLRCAFHQHLTLNTHHPSNMFPLMRTLSTTNTQHPSPVKHVPSDAHFINTQHSTPITQQTCSLRCALHQHPSLNTQHPKFNTQHPSKAPHTLRDNTLHLSANTTG